MQQQSFQQQPMSQQNTQQQMPNQVIHIQPTYQVQMQPMQATQVTFGRKHPVQCFCPHCHQSVSVIR